MQKDGACYICRCSLFFGCTYFTVINIERLLIAEDARLFVANGLLSRLTRGTLIPYIES